jgi:LPXTG-site transpeptidase (sortase) family protein
MNSKIRYGTFGALMVAAAIFAIDAVELQAEKKDVLGPSASVNIVPVAAASTAAPMPTKIITEEEKTIVETPVKTTEPQAISKKKVINPGYPYMLSIPAIKVSAGIKGMGLEEDGKMAVPDNYTEVGWYSLGTKPGRAGNAVLGAHVDDGSSVAGVFKNLKRLKVGDDIFVKDKDGNDLHYRVVERKIYDYREKNTDEIFGKTNKAMLNLITCHGKWLANENTYDSRLVVFAELVA